MKISRQSVSYQKHSIIKYLRDITCVSRVISIFYENILDSFAVELQRVTKGIAARCFFLTYDTKKNLIFVIKFVPITSHLPENQVPWEKSTHKTIFIYAGTIW